MLINVSSPPFLPKVVDFPDIGASFEILDNLATLRSCHDGTPAESRIVFTCQHIRTTGAAGNLGSDGDNDLLQSQQFLVMKVKIQRPGDSPDRPAAPQPGPSTTTLAEIEALRLLSKAEHEATPRLVAWKTAIQGEDGLLPGGYMSYIVMTKLPGLTLADLGYWGMSHEERSEIVERFLPALRSLFTLGIEPLDRALRNVLWDRESKRCTIIDFEIWRETKNGIGDETRELQRWGLAQAPAATTWYAAWNAESR